MDLNNNRLQGNGNGGAGGPPIYQAFDIETLLGGADGKDMVMDDKMARNILGDLRKHLPPGGFPKHKPLLVPTAAA
jgi:hypothetical protein